MLSTSADFDNMDESFSSVGEAEWFSVADPTQRMDGVHYCKSKEVGGFVERARLLELR